jgi:tripartite-type tricarboxylate transporter receptor subunit TctC
MRFLSPSNSFLRALSLIVALASQARADAVSDFYAGKTISLIISTSVGGGFDSYGRLLSRHLSKHVPGAPRVIVQNMPGAGGISAANYLFSVAPKDGLAMGLVQNSLLLEPYFGSKEAKYDVTKFNWLGSASKDALLLMLWHTVPVNTVAEGKTHEMKIGTFGPNSSNAFAGRVLQHLFGLKIELISGYQGSSDQSLGMERGENDGTTVTYSAIKATKPDWLEKKQVKFLLQLGDQPIAELKDVPFGLDLLSDPSDKLTLATAMATYSIAKPYLLPPGVPADRVAALRKGLSDTFNDPDYRAECARMSLDCTITSDGEEVVQLLQQIYAGPKAVHDRLIRIYEMGK